MNHTRGPWWLHVACLLPLAIAFIVLVLGVRMSPFILPLVMLLCCLAMAFLARDTCHAGHDPAVRYGGRFVAPLTSHPPDWTDDVFRVDGADRVGDASVFRGELLLPPDEAMTRLELRFRGSGVTPFLQQGGDGRPVIFLLPDTAPRSVTDRLWLNGLLFGLTLLTTTAIGAHHAGVDVWKEPGRIVEGLAYSVPLLLILGVHELGHYLAGRRHGLPVSLPFFIPVPFGLGTFGAFIQMRGVPPDRRALFDVAAAGPLAGLAVAIPLLWWGLGHSAVVSMGEGGTYPGSSALLALLAKASVGQELAGGHHLRLHPAAFAGWIGLMVTALNLLPVGQLDGGHVADALLGRVGGATAGAVALFALLFLGLFVWGGLLGWAIVVYLLAGEKGIPARNDLSPVGGVRWVLGALLFAVLVLTLAPLPPGLAEALGFRCPYL